MRRIIRTKCLFWIVLPLTLEGCASPKVWVERTETRSLPVADASGLAIETHNGRVECDGDAAQAQVDATIRIRAGGATLDSANEALAAIELVAEPTAEGVLRLTWRWPQDRRSDWAAEVAFDVKAPPALPVFVETHNGHLRVSGMTGGCELRTHNGNVVANASAGALSIVTHNGDVTATAGGETIALQTHNGDIKLDAASATALTGGLETHNGSIHARFGPGTSAELVCETHNGRVRPEIAWNAKRVSRRFAEGSLGTGGAEFRIQTHNGGIVLTN